MCECIFFSFCTSFMSDISKRYILIFHTTVNRFRAFFFLACLGALQTFPLSVHIRRFEVWRCCIPPPHVRCVTVQNIPLCSFVGCYSVKQSAQRERADWSLCIWGILADWNQWFTHISGAGYLLECQKYHRVGARVVSNTEYLGLQR